MLGRVCPRGIGLGELRSVASFEVSEHDLDLVTPFEAAHRIARSFYATSGRAWRLLSLYLQRIFAASQHHGTRPPKTSRPAGGCLEVLPRLYNC